MEWWHVLRRNISAASLLNAGGVAITLIVGVAAWCGAAALRERSAYLEQYRQQELALLDRAQEIGANHRLLTQQCETMELAVKVLRDRLPGTPEETQFLQQISELAERSQLELSDFRPGGLSDRKDFKDIELHIRAVGDYASLCRFVAGIQELPRSVHIGQLAIAAPNEVGGPCSMDMRLLLAFGLSAENQASLAQVQP
jgi:Tfp pilus assembly protein PilO